MASESISTPKNRNIVDTDGPSDWMSDMVRFPWSWRPLNGASMEPRLGGRGVGGDGKAPKCRPRGVKCGLAGWLVGEKRAAAATFAGKGG